MDTAYSYIRFSSDKQEQGDSIRRQTKAARDYAAAHGLILDTQTYQEFKGISAFTGENKANGKLGLFVEAAEKGLIPKGSRLIVESLDRLSREAVDLAMSQFLRITAAGIIIVTLGDHPKEYSTASIRANWTELILTLAQMERAHDESATKSKRVSEAWENKRNTDKIMTRMVPAWLSTDDYVHWEIDPEKAAVVQRIFAMAHDEGLGTPTIARRLNADGVPTFKKPTKKELEAIARGEELLEPEWSHGTVAHVLNNKAVIGILHTEKVYREDYYPPIIKKEVFESMGMLFKQRHFAPGARGQGGIVNLFSGRSYCGICGKRMKTVSQHEHNVYLHCERAYQGSKDCKATRVAYHAFEEDILKHLIIAQHRLVFKLREEVAHDPREILRRQLEVLEGDIETALDRLLSTKSEALSRRLEKLEADKVVLLDQIKNAVVIPKATNVLNDLVTTYKRFVELQKTDKDSEEYKALRKRLQTGLRGAVKKIEFHHKPGSDGVEHYRVTFLSGTERERTYRRPPKGFQPGNIKGKR
ncbi:hypothetical protein DBA29_20270 [Xenophilus aerolatus]|nr:hypothetical protein [Xenophilus aerolatus]